MACVLLSESVPCCAAWILLELALSTLRDWTPIVDTILAVCAGAWHLQRASNSAGVV